MSEFKGIYLATCRQNVPLSKGFCKPRGITGVICVRIRETDIIPTPQESLISGQTPQPSSAVLWG